MINNFEIRKKEGYEIKVTEYLPEENKIEKVLVMCHGFSGSKNSDTIKMMAEKLITLNIAVVALDLPCHGESQVAEDEFNLKNTVEDIYIVTMYASKLSKHVSIFATSIGAYFTLNLLQDNHFNYEKVILKSPAICMDEIFFNGGIITCTLEQLKERGSVYAGFGRQVKISYDTLIELKKNRLLEKYNKNYNILILHATEDDTAPIEDAVEFAEKKENVCIKKLVGGDHRLKTEEQRKWVYENTVKFLCN